MNKKGTEKLLSMYWFLILIIVAAGVFVMIYNFYHYPYDIREIEANVIVNHVADCVSTAGKINSYVIEETEFNQEFKENFLQICNLNFNVEAEWEDVPQYYLSLNFYEAQTESLLFNIEEGNKNIVSSCAIQEDKEQEKLAKCVERSFYSFDQNENLYLIKILSIVRKTEKNVR